MKKILITLLPILTVMIPQHVHGQVSDSLVLALMDQYDVPGLSLAVVRGDSVSTSSWGYADADGSIAVTADTPFRIASVAKVFVAATVMTEVSLGTISLDEDVSDLIPNVGGFSGPITLHHLLTHTAGFDERLIAYGARSSKEMRPLGEYLADRMPSRGWPTGEQISYSNHGMALAALAVERVRRRSFAGVAASNVFEPLAMRSTGFLIRGRQIPANSAVPLSCEEGKCEPVQHFFSHAYPAGLAFSTASDMSRFLSAMLRAEEEESPLAALIPERFTHDERIPGMSYGFFNQYHNGFRFLSHAGSVPGYWSLLLVSPDANLGFFFVTNGGSARFGEQFRDVLLRTFLEDEPESLPLPAVTEEPSLRSGIYELTRYSHETIERFPQVFANSIELTTDADTLKVFSGGRVRKYIQTGNNLYENLDGSDKIVFGERRGESRLFRSSTVYGAEMPASYEKRPWYRAPGFVNEYVSWLFGVPILCMFLIWPLSAGIGWYFRRRRGGKKHPDSMLHGSVSVLLAMTFVLFTIFGFGFVARSNRMLESGELIFGIPDSLLLLSWIPVVHVALTILLCVALFLSLKNMWWDRIRRILFTILVVALVLQVVFLVQWNYLPLSW